MTGAPGTTTSGSRLLWLLWRRSWEGSANIPTVIRWNTLERIHLAVEGSRRPRMPAKKTTRA
ncbi:MAG TPA: hypothetical protein VLI91_03760, partial [Roseiarcus sp.]|nr:hypothetical protein [Roseiarcus sp.]